MPNRSCSKTSEPNFRESLTTRKSYHISPPSEAHELALFRILPCVLMFERKYKLGEET